MPQSKEVVQTSITHLYLACFGRAPDSEGLEFWTDRVLSGQSLVEVANNMLATAPARVIYPDGMPAQDMIGAFYENVLGRTPDAPGLEFWTARLESSAERPGAVILELLEVVINYTPPQDPEIAAIGLRSQTLFFNKVSAAQYMTQAGLPMAQGRELLGKVSHEPASVDEVKMQVDAAMHPGPSNLAPTAVALTDTITSIAENTPLTSPIEMATLAITDDGRGVNTVSLSGQDADRFLVQDGKLYLKAGAALDYEAQKSLSVTVSVADASVPGSSPVSSTFTLGVTDVDETSEPINQAPTAIALSAITLTENTLVGQGLKVGDLTIIDPDASGNNNSLTLEGADAAFFQIRNNSELYFVGSSPDYEAKSAYSITVKSTDGTLTFSQPLTISITNVNEAPTDIGVPSFSVQ